MKYYDMNINGVDLINGKGFESEEAMIKWVIKVLKNSTKDKDDTVVVSLSVIDRITPAHFIKFKFLSYISDDKGRVSVTHCKI